MHSRVLRGLHQAEDFLLASLLGVLLVLAVLQIVLRMFFHSGLEWAEPVSRIGVLWLALFGALGATRTRRHIAIDALPRFLPPQLQRAAWSISQFSAAVVCALLAWYGWGMVQLEQAMPAVFVPGIPSWWPMLAFPLVFALMGLRFIVAGCDRPTEPGAG